MTCAYEDGLVRETPAPTLPRAGGGGSVAPFPCLRRGKCRGWGLFARYLNLRQESRQQPITAKAAARIDLEALKVVRREGRAELLVDVFHLLISDNSQSRIGQNELDADAAVDHADRVQLCPRWQ